MFFHWFPHLNLCLRMPIDSDIKNYSEKDLRILASKIMLRYSYYHFLLCFHSIVHYIFSLNQIIPVPSSVILSFDFCNSSVKRLNLKLAQFSVGFNGSIFSWNLLGNVTLFSLFLFVPEFSVVFIEQCFSLKWLRINNGTFVSFEYSTFLESSISNHFCFFISSEGKL